MAYLIISYNSFKHFKGLIKDFIIKGLKVIIAIF
jgi:hypothetical protein